MQRVENTHSLHSLHLSYCKSNNGASERKSLPPLFSKSLGSSIEKELPERCRLPLGVYEELVCHLHMPPT
jgi:hypothetical protein